MNLTQVFKIARREYLARVRSRAFILMTILVPVLLGAYMFAAPMMMRSSSANIRLAILDDGAGAGEALAARLTAIERPRVEITEVTAADAAARDRLKAALLARTLDGYLLVEPRPDGWAAVRYYARVTGNSALTRELRSAVQAAALDKVLAGTGVNPDDTRRAQQLPLTVVTVTDRGEREGGIEAALISTMTLAMLLYIAVLINGQGMATAIVEEKSSRLIEVILGAVTATEFMAGKITGVLASGLTQLAVWVLAAMFALLQAAPALAMSSPGGLDLSLVLNGHIIFYFSLFFMLGYALYSILFAVVAVTCTSTEELGQSMMAAMLPMVAALMMSISVISNPATTMTRVLSLIPLFTPLVMLTRVNILMPPWWEV